MHYRSARVTLYTTVFVSEMDMAEARTKAELEGREFDEKQEFLKLAFDKISTHFLTDEPMKLQDMDFDMESFK